MVFVGIPSVFKADVPFRPALLGRCVRCEEMYQNVLGPEALPAEFYFFPTEHWLNGWYHDVSGMPHEWNETELRRLHLDAAQALRDIFDLESMLYSHDVLIIYSYICL